MGCMTLGQSWRQPETISFFIVGTTKHEAFLETERAHMCESNLEILKHYTNEVYVAVLNSSSHSQPGNKTRLLSSRAGVCKLRPSGQIRPTVCFCMA
jgi:hypothetical protein